jgi:hypothetical protein
MVHRVLIVLGVTLVFLCCIDATGQSGESELPDLVAQDCLQRSGRQASCACLSREAHTRFTDAELRLVVGMSEGRFSSQLDQSGLDLIEQETLRRRVRNADQVIRQACGVGLFVVNTDVDRG